MSQLHYKPLYRAYQLNETVYQMIDSKQADNRALYFSLQAKALRENHSHKNHFLRLATDYGCIDSPYLLARRILCGFIAGDFNREDAIILFNIAAQRGCKQAAFEMACCYDGSEDFPDILSAGKNFFAALSVEERELLAQYYFSLAEHGLIMGE